MLRNFVKNQKPIPLSIPNVILLTKYISYCSFQKQRWTQCSWLCLKIAYVAKICTTKFSSQGNSLCWFKSCTSLFLVLSWEPVAIPKFFKWILIFPMCSHAPVYWCTITWPYRLRKCLKSVPSFCSAVFIEATSSGHVDAENLLSFYHCQTKQNLTALHLFPEENFKQCLGVMQNIHLLQRHSIQGLLES